MGQKENKGTLVLATKKSALRVLKGNVSLQKEKYAFTLAELANTILACLLHQGFWTGVCFLRPPWQRVHEQMIVDMCGQ